MMMASPILRLITPRAAGLATTTSALAAASRPRPSHPPPLPRRLRPATVVFQIVSRTGGSSAAGAANNNVVGGGYGGGGGGIGVVGAYGLRPPDYAVLPPIRPSPPPPPAKPGLSKYLWILTLGFSAISVAYFYANNKNDNYEYW